MTDIFQINWFKVRNKIAKIAKIFVKTEDPSVFGDLCLHKYFGNFKILFLTLNQFIWKTSIATMATLTYTYWISFRRPVWYIYQLHAQPSVHLQHLRQSQSLTHRSLPMAMTLLSLCAELRVRMTPGKVKWQVMLSSKARLLASIWHGKCPICAFTQHESDRITTTTGRNARILHKIAWAQSIMGIRLWVTLLLHTTKLLLRGPPKHFRWLS